LRGFEALLHDANFNVIDSMWPLAEEKLGVYRENREILLSVLQEKLGAYPEHFAWTQPQAGFFSVFTFLQPTVKTDDSFIESLVAEYGVVAIPMYDFYPADAKQRDPNAGLNQLRLSFCFSESIGDARRKDMAEAIAAFCSAALKIAGLPG
jgi:DNA-binding transcriptional MocR family regulator